MSYAANIILRQRNPEQAVFVYVHDGAHDCFRTAVDVLCSINGQARIGDPGYLTRYVIDALSAEPYVGTHSGLAVSTELDDNDMEYVLVIDTMTGRVWTATPDPTFPERMLEDKFADVVPSRDRTTEQVLTDLFGAATFRALAESEGSL